MTIGLEIVIVLLLIVLNGLFAMGELALASVRRARLVVLERKGVPGAAMARELWLLADQESEAGRKFWKKSDRLRP